MCLGGDGAGKELWNGQSGRGWRGMEGRAGICALGLGWGGGGVCSDELFCVGQRGRVRAAARVDAVGGGLGACVFLGLARPDGKGHVLA